MEINAVRLFGGVVIKGRDYVRQAILLEADVGDVPLLEKLLPALRNGALGVLTDGDATNSRSEADYADFVLFDRKPEPDLVGAQVKALGQLEDGGTADLSTAPKGTEAQPGVVGSPGTI